jgi:hypothetical protein
MRIIVLQNVNLYLPIHATNKFDQGSYRLSEKLKCNCERACGS